ncbi:MAG: hypothetical protein H0W66_04575 [Chthoniobacterales bacterium]|nr:hypothetical protein [Chthoniobacterales bacterium]
MAADGGLSRLGTLARFPDGGVYFAVFRAGDDLVFWHADRKDRYKAGAVGVDDASGKSAWDSPGRWATLKVELRYPKGSITSVDQGAAFLIAGRVQGKVQVTYSVGAGGGNYRNVFQQWVRWGQKVAAARRAR